MISIIIPNYNDIRIQNALEAILASKSSLEVLIVDGKSSNQKVLDFYDTLTDKRVKILRYEDNGIFDAINYGIGKARGKIIYLQGSDDVMSDEIVFQHVSDYMEENENCDGFCIGCKFVDETGQVKRSWFPENISSNKIRMGLLPPHFSLFLRREIYDKVGNFEFVYGENDLSLDSLWLLKMGHLFQNLNIRTSDKYWLVMALGGISTGSYRGVLAQNVKLYHLLKHKEWRTGMWFLVPAIKVISKLGQFKW